MDEILNLIESVSEGFFFLLFYIDIIDNSLFCSIFICPLKQISRLKVFINIKFKYVRFKHKTNR